MADPDIPGGADTPAPADDLRSTLEAAFAADAEPQEGVSEIPGAEQPPAPATPTDRPRDEQGRFVRQQAEQAAREAQQAIRSPQPTQQGQPGQPAPAVPAGPPPGWSVASKAIYDKLPDPVKADIQKREVEVAAGFAKLAEYKPLDTWIDMARQQQTTLPEALERYVAAENLLEAQPINGILWLCQRYQVHPARLLQAIQGEAGGPQPPQASPLDPVFGQLQALDGRLTTFEQEQERQLNQQAFSEMERFRADPANRYFENVRYDMGRRMKFADINGEVMDLKQAYDEACWAHPEIRQQLINEQQTQATSQRRAQSNGLAAKGLPPGSPIAGGTLSNEQPAATLREEIMRSFHASRV